MASRNYPQTDDEERPDDMPQPYTQPRSLTGVFSDSELHSQHRSDGRISRHAEVRPPRTSLGSAYPATSHVPTLERVSQVREEYPNTTGVYPSHQARGNTNAMQNYLPPQHQQRHHRQRHNSARLLQAASPLTLPVMEVRFMEPHDSYHGAITGDEAATRLSKVKMDHCYLSRFSYRHNCYVLSVRKKDSQPPVGHFKLVIDRNVGGSYYVDGMERKFNNIEELLVFYENNRIHPLFENIGRCLTVQNYTYLQQKFCVIL